MTPISLWLEGEQDQTSQRRYDVLLAVQPSKMNPAELDNLIAAIRTGQPTIIFEDPFPSPENFPHLRGTTLPRHITRQSIDNCDMSKLWEALDLDIDRIQRGERTIPWLVWNSDKPYKRDSSLDLPERVIIVQEDQEVDPRFAEIPATRGIDELYFPFTGYLRPFPNSNLEFIELVRTGLAGRILLSDFTDAVSEEMRAVTRGSTSQQFTLAAWIRGTGAASAQTQTAAAAGASKDNTNVIYICDMDVLADYFFEIRDYPIRNGIQYRFQNWAFVLNLIDNLADEPTFLDLRTREVRHLTLRLVEDTVDAAMQEVYEATNQYQKELSNYQNKIQSEAMEVIRPLNEEISQMQQKQRDGGQFDNQALQAKQALLQITQQEQQQKYQRKIEEMQNERQERLRAIQLDAELKIQRTQRWYKLVAVILPPIPPLLVGLIVFTRRRLREREGISKARRLK
jgi:ABC-2 type transport system permease protein